MIPRWKRAAFKRQRNALRDSTWDNYKSGFKLFFAFCLHFNINPLNCNQESFNTFTEMLIEAGLKGRSIVNILSGIRTICIWTGINTAVVQTVAWARNIQSINRTLRDEPKFQSSMKIEHLIRLIRFFGKKTIWTTLKLFVLLSFFGLLRLSNLVPKTFSRIDKKRNTLIKDIWNTNFGLAILIKWTKTRQENYKPAFVPLPKILHSCLCPVSAMNEYKQKFRNYNKYGENLLLSSNGKLTGILTAGKVRKALRLALEQSGLSQFGYTPHSLRRGGAVYLHSQGVPITAIKQHGLWTSNCIELYLNDNFPRAKRVTKCFASSLNNLSY